MAAVVKANRRPMSAELSPRRLERVGVDTLSASLEYCRAMRDLGSEASFFQIYGNLFAFYLSDERDVEAQTPRMDPRELPFVRKALASIDKGGYAEAVARVAFLLAHKDEPLPLSRLQLAQELIEELRLGLGLVPDSLPDVL